MSIVTCEQKHSSEWEIKLLGLKQGNHPFELKTWLEAWDKGGTIIQRQKSNLLLNKTHGSDLRFRPVVGFYKELCEEEIPDVERVF